MTLYTKRRVNMNTSTFFENLKRYLAVLALLTVINLISSPNYLWVIWPALGMGIALLNDLLDLNNSKRVG
ncbi:2TM domain-containing protein [Pseudoalteromonas sp. SIMBA_162]